MIRFLLQRPIAVLMAFMAFFLLGLATYFTLPVSLLPDIAIPEITVQVSGANRSARELENTVVKPVRLQLMQVAGLRDIHSETRDGAAIVRLHRGERENRCGHELLAEGGRSSTCGEGKCDRYPGVLLEPYFEG